MRNEDIRKYLSELLSPPIQLDKEKAVAIINVINTQAYFPNFLAFLSRAIETIKHGAPGTKDHADGSPPNGRMVATPMIDETLLIFFEKDADNYRLYDIQIQKEDIKPKNPQTSRGRLS
jgi:hypothetical protein